MVEVAVDSFWDCSKDLVVVSAVLAGPKAFRPSENSVSNSHGMLTACMLTTVAINTRIHLVHDLGVVRTIVGVSSGTSAISSSGSSGSSSSGVVASVVVSSAAIYNRISKYYTIVNGCTY